MASDASKRRAHAVYKILTPIHWLIVVVMFATDGAAIHYAQGTTGFWGGGLAVAIMMFFVSIQSLIIFKSVLTFDSNAISKKKFIDTYNWQGLNILLTMGAGIAGIATAVALGVNRNDTGRNDQDMSTNTTNTTNEHSHNNDEYVNLKEIKTLGTMLAVFSAVTLLVMAKTICLHGEIRAACGIPQNSNEQPASATTRSATPRPQPQASTSNGACGNDAKREIQLLTTQNNLLKEQNQLQKQQLEQMTALNRRFQSLSAQIDAGSIPPPPDYNTVMASASPGYAFPGGPPGPPDEAGK